MKLSSPLVFGAGCFALALLVLGCGPGSQGNLLAPGSPAPEIVASEWINGPAPTAGDLQGRVLVLSFWAYWCGPCRAHAPELVETYRRHESQGVVFLGVTPEGADTVNESKEFIQSGGIPWPAGLGAGTTFSAFGVNGIPAEYVIGRDGLVAWHSGLEGSLDEAIQKALAAKG